MRKLNFLFLLIFLPIVVHAQFLGVGGQYSQKSDGQFFISGSYPIINKGENLFISSGMEYTTSGGSRLSGLNIKPIQLNADLSENSPITFLLGVDGGYLFDFRNNHKNTIIVSPTIYMDYSFFFIKGGYDIDMLHGNSQFFVRLGVGIGIGLIKNWGCRPNREYKTIGS